MCVCLTACEDLRGNGRDQRAFKRCKKETDSKNQKESGREPTCCKEKFRAISLMHILCQQIELRDRHSFGNIVLHSCQESNCMEEPLRPKNSFDD